MPKNVKKGKRDYSMVPMAPPGDYYIYDGVHEPDSDFNPHTHEWGQLTYLRQGVTAFVANGQRLFAMPEFGVWIPPHTEHATYNHFTMTYCCLNIKAELSRILPDYPCQIAISKLFGAVMLELHERRCFIPVSNSEHRLFLVLIDQLAGAKCQVGLLPGTDDELLTRMLHVIESSPADNTSLPVWAERLFTSESTLARRFRDKLGISFIEWRQRLRFSHALAMLDKGLPVGEVALSVGYQSISSFIAMFQKIAGITPEKYRRSTRKHK